MTFFIGFLSGCAAISLGKWYIKHKGWQSSGYSQKTARQFLAKNGILKTQSQ